VLYKIPYNNTHIVTHFLPYTIEYCKPTTPIELNKKSKNEPLAIKILCIHHKTTPIHTINLTPKMQQITTNLQIPTPYINTPTVTPINTKVHKYCAWQKTSNLQPTHTRQSPHHASQYIITTNLINLYHTYATTLMDHYNP
jgi:hypothetical protein